MFLILLVLFVFVDIICIFAVLAIVGMICISIAQPCKKQVHRRGEPRGAAGGRSVDRRGQDAAGR